MFNARFLNFNLIINLFMYLALNIALNIANPVKAAQQVVIIPHVLTFFIEWSPEPQVAPVKPVVITEPGSLNKMIMQQKLKRQTVQGVYALYNGWTTYSDINGQILFPRIKPTNHITLVITRSLQPLLTQEAQPYGFAVPYDEPAAYYSFDLIKNSTTQKNEWHIKKQEMPANRAVPIDALVLLAKPTQITVQEGVFPNPLSDNLVLPTFYALPSLTPGINALYFLKINKYFAPVKYITRYSTNRYSTILAPIPLQD